MPPPPPLTDALVREAESLLLGLLRNDLIGVYVIQDHVLRYANRRFAEMFGYTPDDIRNQPALEQFVAPHDRERVLANVARRIRGEASTAHYTFRGKHRDGRTLEMEVFGNRTQLEGRPAIIGLMLDITARKAAEQTTVEQLHFIGQLLEAIPSPVFFKDNQARYLGCNKAFETYIGRQRGELIGRSVFDISPPELAARYHEADQRLFDHPGVQTYEASVESTDGMRKEVIFNKATWLRSDGSVGGLVGVITDITDRKQTEALIWMQANYDPLTGLPNRRLLNDRLAEQIKRAQRDQGSLAVLFIDLDRFKEVNDALGHEAGDQLLMEAARRVVGCVRGTDTVARQGGDEFTVLLPGLSERAPIERIAEDIILALTEPFQLGNEQAYVSASIGITLFPQDADNPVAILKQADQAMYHAKEEGRNRFSYFSPAMQERAMLRVQLGKDLRAALAEQIEIRFTNGTGEDTRLTIDGQDASAAIRTPQVDANVSKVSAYPGVRAAMLIHQRRAAEDRDIVAEGRDIGTVVFPNAQVKVFLTADPRERARRRVLQRHQNDAQPLTAEQLEAEVDETLDALKQRDKLDSSREVAPLVPAEDAVHVDSTAHTIDEVVRIIEDLINQRR